MHVKLLQKKDFVENVWPWLFMFRPTTLKRLNSLTTIDTFSCLGGPEVTHHSAVREVPGSIPDSGKAFYV